MKKLMPIFMTLSLVLFFQNCSDVAFQNEASTDVAKIDTELDPELPDSSSNDDDTVTSPDDETDLAYEECAGLKAVAEALTLVASDQSIQGGRGNLAIKSEHIGRIDSLQGKLRVLGLGDSASVGIISGTAGNILVCNMDIDRIEGVSQGKITVVNGNIGSIDGFRGQILVLRGNILGSVQNNLGTISVRDQE